MLTKSLVLKIFEGFSIERWNDLVRPFDMIEMDKAAEKMMVAYIIGKFEEERGQSLDWDWMIHASFFELLRKIALCDIKSPVQRMIRRDYPAEYRKLNQWVVQQYRELLPQKGLLERLRIIAVVPLLILPVWLAVLPGCSVPPTSIPPCGNFR